MDNFSKGLDELLIEIGKIWKNLIWVNSSMPQLLLVFYLMFSFKCTQNGEFRRFSHTNLIIFNLQSVNLSNN